MPTPGELLITPLKADIERNDSSGAEFQKKYSKQDPYCLIRVGSNQVQTNPDEFGGKTPKWAVDEPFVF